MIPYKEGEQLIAALQESPPFKEYNILLRRAQRYTVHIHSQDWRELEKQEALHPLGDTGMVYLDARFYDENAGVAMEPVKELENLIN